MCGFAGLLNGPFTLTKDSMTDIAAKVSWRGPDSCGVGIFDRELQTAPQGNTALFFNRLAIMDLDPRSDQPFSDERYTLTFNGEIYNYKELKAVLEKSGKRFHTTSDTEVLFYALQFWGVEALQRLNGMFAFCWLDRQEKRFLLARDRIGIKPLYYCQQESHFAFGSELDSIVRLTKTLPDVDPSAVHNYLWMQFIPTPYTIARGVFKLPPGHYIQGTWADLDQRRELSPVAFWDAYAVQPLQPADKPPGEDLESVLTDSLARQLVADVPLGLFLSSGVDSSLLAALVNKHFVHSRPFNFFTVAFTEQTTSDESADALSFIKGFNNPGLITHTLAVDPHSVGEHLDELYTYFDEPFGDFASLLNWIISRKAREFVTVALSGDGADELFWGYPRYEQWRSPALGLPGGLTLDGSLARLVTPFMPGRYWSSKARLQLERDPVKRHFTLFCPPAAAHLLERPIWNEDIWAMKGVEKIRDRPDLTAWLDLKTYLPDAMLYKVDRASMAASLEVRVPYLDNKVIDYALAMPLTTKSGTAFRHKAPLKELLHRLAPHYDIQRPKKGFNFPLDRWLRFEWRDRVQDMITEKSLAALGLDAKRYLPAVRRYYAGDKRYCLIVWYLFNLVLWHQKYKSIIPLRQTV
jgi:asparagine synthase (glutamine-hydrolysing)